MSIKASFNTVDGSDVLKTSPDLTLEELEFVRKLTTDNSAVIRLPTPDGVQPFKVDRVEIDLSNSECEITFCLVKDLSVEWEED
jgi:hypothetical protein